MLPGVDGILYLMRPLSFFHPRLRFNPNTRGPPKLHSPLLSFHRCYSSLRLLYTYIQITLRPFLTTFPPSIAERERGRIEREDVRFIPRSRSSINRSRDHTFVLDACNFLAEMRKGFAHTPRAEEISWVAVI